MRIRLSEHQARFTASDALYRALVGGRGAGKSWVGAYDLLKRANRLGMRGRLFAVYAPTYPMLLDSSYRSFLAMGAQLACIAEVNKSNLRATLANGAEVLFRSVDDPERARGPNLSGAWLDEASLMERAAFDIIIACLREGGEQGWLSATFTPKGKQHWTYEVFGNHPPPPNTALFHGTTLANPFLPSEFEAAVRAQYTATYAQQELGGEFVDLEGALFRRQWFRVVDVPPGGLSWVRYWDLAASVKTSANYTASAAVALATDGVLYIRDMVRGRWEWPEAKRIIMTTMLADPAVVHGIEQALHGLAAVQELRREPSVAGVTLRGINVDKDKLARAMPWAARAEAGKVALVRGAWIEPFLSEVTAFPVGAHDDQVDTISGGVSLVAQSVISIPPPVSLEQVSSWRLSSGDY